jgi:hypothetical protein
MTFRHSKQEHWRRWVEQELGDYALNVSKGLVPGTTGVNKFGTNLTVGTSFEDIWIQGGTWTKLPAATTLDVSSSNANDTVAGSGAQRLTIEGLDANYAELSETVDMNGQTPVVTTGVFLFVNRTYVARGGSGFTNEGDLYVADDSTAHSSGVPVTAASIQSKIVATQGQSQQAIYTLPANKTGYITNAWIIAGANKIVDYELHEIDHQAQTNRIIIEGEETNTAFTHVYNPYESVNEKHTLIFDAKITSGTAEISAGFDLYLVDN